MNGNLEEALKVALERLQSLEERAESLRRRHRSLKKRSRRALERLRDAIAELEEGERFGDGNRVHVRNALEILYDVVHDLEVVENE
jgi:predicted  nucleic acid-binding Zn-ribbon protein